MTDLLSAALRYAARGWPVFPCRGKQPYTAHGVDDASTDPDQINLWWVKHPNANIGLATGRASGLYIIDEDAEGAADHLELPATLTAYTGKGRHYYYAIPEDGERWPNTAQKALGPGVDSRGDGGYVIAPPSVHAGTGRVYAFGESDEAVAPLPANVQELLRRPRTAAPTLLPAAAVGALYASTDVLERARRYLGKVEGAIAGTGGHDATYRVANMLVNGFALGRHDASVLLWEWNRACQPPWSERELEHKLSDAEKAGNYNGRDRGCLLQDRREDAVAVVSVAVEAVTDAAPDSAGQLTPFAQAIKDLYDAGFGGTDGKRPDGHALHPFVTGSSLFGREFPATPWIIKGVLTPASLCAIGGEPKTTKTWAAIEMAMAIATGTPAFGEFPVVGEPAPVALFLTEDNEQSLRNRLRALAHSRGMDPVLATGNMHVTCLQSLELSTLAHLAALVVAVRAIGEGADGGGAVRLLVLDPLRNLHNAEENSSTEMNVILGAMRALRTVLGCSVLFVHHMSKGDPTKTGKAGGQALRGSGALHGAVDCGLYLTGLKTDDQTTWSNKAQVQIKGARGAGRFDLSLDVVDDAGGDEAIEAAWTIARTGAGGADGAEAGVDAKEAEAVAAVEAELVKRWEQNPSAPDPISKRDLRPVAGVGMLALEKAIAVLALDGRAEMVFRGKKSLGWIYRPSDSDMERLRGNDAH